VLNIAMSCW